jgi:peptide/nickel transport system permease protein
MIDETLAHIELAPERGVESRERPGQSFWRESLERLRQNRLGMVAGGLIALLALIAICAPLISAFVTHHNPARQNLENNFALPGGANWLGTDELGRDTLTRLVWGAQISLGIGFLTVAIQLTFGAALGMIAGYYGRIVDDVTMRVVDVILAFPPIFLFIGLSILFRPSTLTLSLIIAFVGWGAVARLVRAEVFSIKNRDFMLATRSVGARDLRLIVGHLLPNAMPVMIVSSSLALGQIILIEAALDFLGLGIQPPTASWGNMLTNAQTYFEHSVWLVLFPGVTIFVTVLAANLFGNAVRDAFDPRLR